MRARLRRRAAPSAGVASNTLWPRTLIATAAVQNLLGGDEAMKRSRKPELYADAAYAVVTRPSRECTGNSFLCEDVLAEEGVTDMAPVRRTSRARSRRSTCSSTTSESRKTHEVVEPGAMTKPWWAPLTGALFVVVVVISFIFVAGEPPDLDEGAQEIVEHYRDNEDAVFLSGIAGAATRPSSSCSSAPSCAACSRRRRASAASSSLVAFAGRSCIAVGLAIDGTISMALSDSGPTRSTRPSFHDARRRCGRTTSCRSPSGQRCSTGPPGCRSCATGVPKWMGWIGVVLGVAIDHARSGSSRSSRRCCDPGA